MISAVSRFNARQLEPDIFCVRYSASRNQQMSALYTFFFPALFDNNGYRIARLPRNPFHACVQDALIPSSSNRLPRASVTSSSSLCSKRSFLSMTETLLPKRRIA